MKEAIYLDLLDEARKKKIYGEDIEMDFESLAKKILKNTEYKFMPTIAEILEEYGNLAINIYWKIRDERGDIEPWEEFEKMRFKRGST